MSLRSSHQFLAALLAGAVMSTAASAQAPLGSERTMARLSPAEVNILRNMSDANILGNLVAADSFEVTLSDSAITHSQSDVVLAYAREVRASHLSSMSAARQIGRQTGIGVTMIVNGLSRRHVFAPEDSVTTASDYTIDRHYIVQQVEMHRHMLAELTMLQDVAKDQRVKDHVGAAIPVEQAQLDKAYALAKAKGVQVKGMKS